MEGILKIRTICFGQGRPKICVPLTGKSAGELISAAAYLKNIPCDMAEWRADCFESLDDPVLLQETMLRLRDALGNLPFLFTVRTASEGGQANLSEEDYLACCRIAIESGLPDLIDTEFSHPAETVQTLLSEAHRAGIAVVGSRHDFQKTPPREEIVSALCRMQDAGCDMAKYAVMPQSERDVLTLLDATLTMKESHKKTPVITMSMGKTGVISRISGELFGSAVTFGAVCQASAPGQLPAEEMASVLNLLA